ncbi:hypothetical protein R1sor_013344 [Riccia sorocarpa]|uniref:Uncharacterized protein n=1 Tax=Riccia sorocarpa TaxID=122646 RepID=A0ABD3H9U3_9MARC
MRGGEDREILVEIVEVRFWGGDRCEREVSRDKGSIAFGFGGGASGWVGTGVVGRSRIWHWRRFSEMLVGKFLDRLWNLLVLKLLDRNFGDWKSVVKKFIDAKLRVCENFASSVVFTGIGKFFRIWEVFPEIGKLE